ncbi:MAG TPA: short chain dehydrogenase [Thermoanaerobaculia bacterium]|nr:short chain dehydrogenase [Thermoanaerobaculia bacterium]
MRIVVVGATGTIGREIVKALQPEHEIVPVNRHSTAIKADIADPSSLRAMYKAIGRADAVICAAGEARRKPLAELTDDDFAISLRSKLMGQVNLVRYGLDHVSDGGSFTLTSGVLARQPIPGSEALTLVNAGVEGFVRAAALEMPRHQRVNIVSPPWVNETLQQLNMKGILGLPAAVVARAYVNAVLGKENGQVIEPR